MLTAKMFVMIMTFWGDSIITVDFTSYDNCVKAGEAMQKVKAHAKHGQPIQFVCVEK